MHAILERVSRGGRIAYVSSCLGNLIELREFRSARAVEAAVVKMREGLGLTSGDVDHNAGNIHIYVNDPPQ